MCQRARSRCGCVVCVQSTERCIHYREYPLHVCEVTFEPQLPFAERRAKECRTSLVLFFEAPTCHPRFNNTLLPTALHERFSRSLPNLDILGVLKRTPLLAQCAHS